jgi:hypothetical protein
MFWQGFKRLYQSAKNSCKFLRNPIKSLIRRLQAIIDGQSNHTKYPPRGAVHTKGPIQGQNLYLKGQFILNIHEGSFYLARTVLLRSV